MVNQRQASDITATWLSVRAALEAAKKRARNIFLPKNIFVCFERRSSFVHPCTFVFLSSSDQRPNW